MNPGISVLFGDHYHVVPEAWMCGYIISRWIRNESMSRGQKTVLLLMQAGF